MIVTTSALSLPEASAFRRDMPRAPAQRQPGYEASFDQRTLFYDAFRHDDDVVLSGPPLFNLLEPLRQGRFISAGHPLEPIFADINRTQRSVLRGRAADSVSIVSPIIEAILPISPDGRDLFRGRRTLVTISRNNRLEWIADWARFYARIHDVDAVLLYDNGSDAYSLAELDQALSSVSGIRMAVIVDWPFPFGPGAFEGGTWDSDFGHCGVLEHARVRFLGEAAQVINADIDELVITSDGRPLHRHLAETRRGALTYHGRWIDGPVGEAIPRVADFDQYDPTRARCPPKWTLVPALVPPTSQWSIHQVVGRVPEYASAVRYGHFRRITTNWKGNNRLKQRNFDGWPIDTELRRDLDLAFAQ